MVGKLFQMTKNPFENKLTREEFNAWVEEQERLADARIQAQARRTYAEVRRNENRATAKAVVDLIDEVPVVREVVISVVSVLSIFDF